MAAPCPMDLTCHRRDQCGAAKQGRIARHPALYEKYCRGGVPWWSRPRGSAAVSTTVLPESARLRIGSGLSVAGSGCYMGGGLHMAVQPHPASELHRDGDRFLGRAQE